MKSNHAYFRSPMMGRMKQRRYLTVSEKEQISIIIFVTIAALLIAACFYQASPTLHTEYPQVTNAKIK